MVLGVVFTTFLILIRMAYVRYDQLAGTMILQEMLENVRTDVADEVSPEEYVKKGKEIGNPRLWLGEYDLEFTEGVLSVSGTASAGEWKQEITMARFEPSAFIRRVEGLCALKEAGKEAIHGGDRIQAGNEQELYDHSSGTGLE